MIVGWQQVVKWTGQKAEGVAPTDTEGEAREREWIYSRDEKVTQRETRVESAQQQPCFAASSIETPLRLL